MKKELINEGITILNGEHATPDRCATIIIVGVARSGTSMIGAALRKLGVFLGDKADHAVFEDLVLSKALEAGDPEYLDRVISDYNTRYNIWAIKRPEAFDLLPKYLNKFRNPRLIVMLRDPASIAKRNEISMHTDFLEQLRRAAERTLDLVRFVEEVNLPTLVISYEKALLNPNRLIEKLAEFSGVQLEESIKGEALSAIQNGPDDYLQSSRVWYEGQFHGVVDGVAYGWASRKPGNFVCSVEIWSGNEMLGTGPSNVWSEDLPENIRGRAFSIPLKKSPGIATVEARISGTTVKL